MEHIALAIGSIAFSVTVAGLLLAVAWRLLGSVRR